MEKQDINGALVEKPTSVKAPRKRRNSKQGLFTLADIERKSDMSQEEKDLATHVEICAIRYKGIEEKFDGIEKRLTKVETDISAIKSTMQSGFNDIKILLEKQSNARFIQMTATFGTIAAAVIGVIGYIITH